MAVACLFVSEELRAKSDESRAKGTKILADAVFSLILGSI